MPQDDKEWIVDAGPARRFLTDLLRAVGADLDIAAETADHLVGANLAGHDSHGILRIVQYVELAERGLLHPNARGSALRESPSLLLYDAERGLGQWTSRAATEWCVEQARRTGIAAAAVRHSNHVGRLGHYAEIAAEAGLVSIASVGMAGAGGGRTAPFHGLGQLLGTNPWCFGVPAQDRSPMLADFATSQVAEGKVRMARYRGASLPQGLILDRDGNPSTRPQDLYDGGSLLPLGGELTGHKGYGLGLAAALFGGLATIGDEDPTPAGTMAEPPRNTVWTGGFFIAALDPDWFGGAQAYREMVAALLADAEAMPPAPGHDRVLVPGDPERLSRETRLAHGLPLPDALWRQLTDLGNRLAVKLPPTASS